MNLVTNIVSASLRPDLQEEVGKRTSSCTCQHLKFFELLCVDLTNRDVEVVKCFIRQGGVIDQSC